MSIFVSQLSETG